MSLSVIAGVASLAMEYGPAAIRGISSMFGGSEVADKVADAVEKADAVLGASKEKKELMVTRALQALPPEAMVELEKLKVELEKEQTRRIELELTDKQAEHHETQTTIRSGDYAEDEFVRRARPTGCLRGLYAGIFYILLFEALKALGYGDGANWQMASIMISPFLTYLGWRSADKRGLTKGTGTMVGDIAAIARRK